MQVQRKFHQKAMAAILMLVPLTFFFLPSNTIGSTGFPTKKNEKLIKLFHTIIKTVVGAV